MVIDAGLAFVGPSAAAIATLGDKVASKALAIRAGVPVVPGHHEVIKVPAQALAVADDIGFPLLLKPAAGGGGRGMCIVTSKEEVAPALAACRRGNQKKLCRRQNIDGTLYLQAAATSKSKSWQINTAM